MKFTPKNFSKARLSFPFDKIGHGCRHYHSQNFNNHDFQSGQGSHTSHDFHFERSFSSSYKSLIPDELGFKPNFLTNFSPSF